MTLVVDIAGLRDRKHVFADRTDAGRVLAELVTEGDLVLAIPAGGVPVAAALAEALKLPIDVAVVSKITLPWNSEVGFGAVAFDGTTRLDDRRAPFFGLSPEQIAESTRRTHDKVARRVARLRAGVAAPRLGGRSVVLVDDGLASGFTMEVAIEAVRGAGAGRVIVAVPTAHSEAIARVARHADVVCCANVRSGPSFAVADAYREWHDVSDEEIDRALAREAAPPG